MKRVRLLTLTALICGFALLPSVSQSHCQIPCGIYDDSTRATLLAEHITTIEKAMKQIQALSEEGDKNYNQIVRWVLNKEDHADQFVEIVTQYFLSQRIKVKDASDADAYKKYTDMVTTLHQMMVTAMKCKQTTSLENTAALRELLAKFNKLYFHEH